jgi:Malectin domain/Bacterial Ig domain/Putative Ig domain
MGKISSHFIAGLWILLVILMIGGRAQAAPSYALSVSTNSSRSNAVALQSATLSGPVYVFTSTTANIQNPNPTGIRSVCYWLDNPTMAGTATHCESVVPYDFASTASNGSASPWNTATLASGTHTITQLVTLLAGGSEAEAANFIIGGATSPTAVRINAGATTSYTDNNGNAWLSDSYFTGGTPYTNSGTITGSTPAPQVYHTERYGQPSFAYNIPVSNGSYIVNLDFAETYVTGPGRRIFNVSINGTQVLTNFDIYVAAGGMNIPVTKTFNVAATNGTLNINFLPGSIENPKVNGIEVVPSAGGGGTSTLVITSNSVTSGILGMSYSAALTATGGSTPYTWSIASGALPNGLTLNAGGSLSGTPSVAGSFPFSIQVKDAAAHSASANFSINISTSSPSVAITSPSSGSTVSGTTIVSGTASDTVSISSVQLSVDGGPFANASGTNNWSFSLNTGSLSNGPHSLTAKVTDAAGVSASSSPLAFTVNNGSIASDCTLFASPSGSDSNSGSSPSAPKSFQGAANATLPGSVLCLLGGTYNLSSSFTPPSSGSPSAWIVYKNYDSNPVNFAYTGSADASPIFRLGSGSFPSGGVSYIEFRGLNLNGNGNSGDAFWCQGTHHLRFISNSMSNTGGAGVGSRDCDYLTADHNLINHNGYMPASTSVPQWYGWTSGISYNSNQWFDNYPGFHNIISNNIVVGEFDSSSNHTDGNGIILDLSNGSYTPSTANTPPVLIINNAVYGNGGRCIHAFIVTNFWVVNNTCYKNNLDPTLGTAGSFSTNGSQNGYFINNISVAWSSSDPTYVQESSNSNIQYFADLYFGSSPNFSSSQLIQADPLFLNPPSLSGGQYATALAASLLGNGLTLLPLSPAYGRGIDPSSLSGLPSAILSDLKKYIYTDINGRPRPQGGGSDLGAYQH